MLRLGKYKLRGVERDMDCISLASIRIVRQTPTLLYSTTHWNIDRNQLPSVKKEPSNLHQSNFPSPISLIFNGKRNAKLSLSVDYGFVGTYLAQVLA